MNPTAVQRGEMTLLVDGKQAFPEILRCIDGARQSLVINMFIWRDDAIGNTVAEAVLRAADRGVSVFISVDRYGVVLEKAEEVKRSFFHKRMTLIERFKAQGLARYYPTPGAPKQVADRESELYRRILTHPRITLDCDRMKADHSKYYIIDDEILILGGINIEDKENGSDMHGREYGDYMAKLSGRAYVDAFRQKLSGGENVSEDFFFGLNIKEGKSRRFEMERLYLDMIDSARKELTVVMSYFSPLPQFESAILRAYARGVAVTIMIPACANFQNDTNHKTVKKLLRASNGGIAVYLSPRMLHTKMIITENFISFGSTNITKKAFHQLDELNLFVKNKPSDFCDAVYVDVQYNLAKSQRITSHRDVNYRRRVAFLEGFLV